MTQASVTIDETLQQYDEKIAEVQQRIDLVREQLHTHRAHLTTAIVTRIPDLIEHLCIQAWESKVKGDREGTFTQEHDIAFMRDMKHAMQEAAQVAEHRLQNVTYWIYLTSLSEESLEDKGVCSTLFKTARNQIKILFCEVLGYAGEVLVKYGCMKDQASAWKFRGTPHPYYDGVFSWGGQVKSALDAYDSEIEKYLQFHADRYQLSRDRKTAEIEMRLEIAQAAC